VKHLTERSKYSLQWTDDGVNDCSDVTSVLLVSSAGICFVAQVQHPVQCFLHW